MPELSDNVAVDILPGKTSLAYFRNIGRVKNIISRFSPDIVHAHYATGYGLWGYKQKTAPLILTVWGTDIADALAGKMIIAPIVRRALKKARFITSASIFMMEQTAGFEPSVKDRLVHIPFGIPLESDVPLPDNDSDTVKLIFAKLFYPFYAPEMVLRAFAKALGRVPNIRLTMIGGGPLHDRLLKLTDELNLTHAVNICGLVEMSESSRLIRNSDIMLMPSEKESFGVAALEAAAAGVPVIATKVGGIPEIVEDKYNGILIAPGDEKALTAAIIQLAEDPIMRSRMGEAGRKIARERYDFEKCLDQMEGLYREVAGN